MATGCAPHPLPNLCLTSWRRGRIARRVQDDHIRKLYWSDFGAHGAGAGLGEQVLNLARGAGPESAYSQGWCNLAAEAARHSRQPERQGLYDPVSSPQQAGGKVHRVLDCQAGWLHWGS